MGRSGVGGTPFASIAQVMARDARGDVDHGVRHLKDIVRRHARQRWLLGAIRAAVEELHRSYVTLAGEVTLLGGAGAGVPLGIERISRSQLVQRIHQTGGDFRLIARWCRELESLMADPGVEETQLVLRKWANRDVHLFRILVPLASFAEELREDVAHAMGTSGPSGALLDSCMRNAHRAMVPVFRELSLTAGSLRQFSREFDWMLPKKVPGACPAPGISLPGAAGSGAASQPRAARQ